MNHQCKIWMHKFLKFHPSKTWFNHFYIPRYVRTWNSIIKPLIKHSTTPILLFHECLNLDWRRKSYTQTVCNELAIQLSVPTNSILYNLLVVIIGTLQNQQWYITIADNCNRRNFQIEVVSTTDYYWESIINIWCLIEKWI